MQERRHGPRVSHTERSFLAMLSSFSSLSAQRLEILSNLVRDYTLKVATIGESISEIEAFKRRCVKHFCLLESTRRWVESLSCMVTKVTCSTRCSTAGKKIDAWIQKAMRDSQHYGCTVAYKENNVYNIHLKPTRNKTSAMSLSEDTFNRAVAGLVRTRKTGESRSRRSRGSTLIQCELMRWMMKEHELTGHAVQKVESPLRSVVGSSARTLFPTGRIIARNSLALTVASLVVTTKMCCLVCQMSKQFNRMLGCDGEGCVRLREFVLHIKSLGFKRILVKSDNERSSLCLVERDGC